jgi:site-specific recombinase XerD
VLGLKAGDISQEGSPFYSYRGKGGKTGKRELPLPALQAIETWLASIGRCLATMAPSDSLWSDTRTGRGITSGTFYTNLRRYLNQAGLPPGGVHIFRTAPRSSAATPASRSKKCRAFWITAV